MQGNLNHSLRLILKDFWIFRQANLFVNVIWYSGIIFFFFLWKETEMPTSQSQAEKNDWVGHNALDHILVFHFCAWSPWCLGRHIWQDLPWPGVHVHSVPAPVKKVILEKVIWWQSLSSEEDFVLPLRVCWSGSLFEKILLWLFAAGGGVRFSEWTEAAWLNGGICSTEKISPVWLYSFSAEEWWPLLLNFQGSKGD